jgi:hypothetical protein
LFPKLTNPGIKVDAIDESPSPTPSTSEPKWCSVFKSLNFEGSKDSRFNVTEALSKDTGLLDTKNRIPRLRLDSTEETERSPNPSASCGEVCGFPDKIELLKKTNSQKNLRRKPSCGWPSSFQPDGWAGHQQEKAREILMSPYKFCLNPPLPPYRLEA